MSKTGGGRGTNQYAIKGVGKSRRSQGDLVHQHQEAPLVDLTLPPLPDWDLYDAEYGETPIDEDVRGSLTERYRWVRTKAELNRAESTNISMAVAWLWENPFAEPADLLDQISLRQLHARMFNEVWLWAGKTRVQETNLGVEPSQITQRLQVLLGNTLWQIDNDAYPREEFGTRFHRDLVAIHCFPNGNGRHARLVANELARILGLGRNFYSWGRRSKESPAVVRRRYIDVIKHADSTGDYMPLNKFSTS